MHRMAVSLDALAARDNLLLATWKAARGKHDRPAVARFLADLDNPLDRLSRSILDGCAPQGRFRTFVIHDPKRRTIHAACFADRVLHHAILNLTEPVFERALVDSSYACRPGKGVHAAIAQVQRHLQRFGWCVQVDVDSYFPSVDHARLLTLLARRFKGAGFLALLARIVNAGGGAASGRGLPIGALTSQHFANAYLDRADRFLLETCRAQVRAHVRYMDDIVWWCDSEQQARQTLDALRTFMADALGLTLKPTATIRPSAQGLLFCGCRVTPAAVWPSARKRRRYRAAAERLYRAESLGLADDAALQRAHDGALGALAHTQSLHFRRCVWAAVQARTQAHNPDPGRPSTA